MLKKTFLIVGILFCALVGTSQSLFRHNDTIQWFGPVETAKQCDSVILTTYETTSPFNEKWNDMTPGELIQRSGELKNTALTTVILTSVAGTTLTIVGAFAASDGTFCYIIGGTVAWVGAIAGIAISAVSNKMLQAAGWKMKHMSVQANGITIKF